MSQIRCQPALEFRKNGPVNGRGRGPGRPIGPNPQMRHRSREVFAAKYPCHVTIKVREGVPSLRSVALVKELERSFAKGCERKGFRLNHYSIQGDHAHFVVEANGREALGKGMKSLGARLARAVNRVFKRKGPVLRDRYHLRVMRTPMEVKNGLRYVLLNARRHARKPSSVLRIDPASSGRWFDGWRRKPSAARRPARAQAVAPARTWLLGKGWRRHGLIDPLEVPG